MTYQEILEGITRHRANLVTSNEKIETMELLRKFNEIEWGLQAIAEKLRDEEDNRME